MSARRLSTAASISPSLFARAQSIAVEHQNLSRELQNEYNSQKAQRVGELSPVAKAMGEWETANKVPESRIPFVAEREHSQRLVSHGAPAATPRPVNRRRASHSRHRRD
ncbi:MAG: hypothetical protein Q9218_008030 [Villophora microphyllina]